MQNEARPAVVTDAMRARFEQALAQPCAEALLALATSLRDEGVSQRTLYRLFIEYDQKMPSYDPRSSSITDTLDLIWGGPWAKGRALFSAELTNEDVAD